MAKLNDLLGMRPEHAAQYLQDRRSEATGHAADTQISSDALVLLVVLDGAPRFRESHPDYMIHFCTFASLCKTILEENNAVALPASKNGIVPYFGCGWFKPRMAIDAVAAAVQIHDCMAESNRQRRADWEREYHAIIGIGSSEYSAACLTQSAIRNQTVVEQKIWDLLSEDVRRLLPKRSCLPHDEGEEIQQLERQLEKVASGFESIQRLGKRTSVAQQPLRI